MRRKPLDSRWILRLQPWVSVSVFRPGRRPSPPPPKHPPTHPPIESRDQDAPPPHTRAPPCPPVPVQLGHRTHGPGPGGAGPYMGVMWRWPRAHGRLCWGAPGPVVSGWSWTLGPGWRARVVAWEEPSAAVRYCPQSECFPGCADWPCLPAPPGPYPEERGCRSLGMSLGGRGEKTVGFNMNNCGVHIRHTTLASLPHLRFLKYWLISLLLFEIFWLFLI